MNKRVSKPTIRDVGKEAGVSFAAVSYVLSGSKQAERVSPPTRQRILDAALKLGYVRSSVAAALTRGYTDTVILLAVAWDVVTSFADLMMMVTQAAANRGLTTIVHISNDDRDANEFLQTVPALHPYGMLLLWGSKAASKEQLAYIESLGIPITDLMPAGPERKTVVTADREQAFYLIGRHLVELGHRRIGVVDDFKESFRTSNAKLSGLKRALEESGLALDEDLLQQAKADVFQIGFQGTAELLSRRKDVTAIVCMTDKAAFGAIAAARKLGLGVPDDISITGYGAENESRYFYPALTTVATPLPKIANAALETLVSARSDEEVEPSVQIMGPVELVVGESTGPARTWKLK